MTDEQTRRRWINFGELIALAALIVSALGVWIAWKSSKDDRTTRIVEQKPSVPLSLRGVPDRDGQTITLSPIDPDHGLQSLTLTIKGAPAIEIGSDGRLAASDIQSALKDRPKEQKDVAYSVPVRIDAHYVEMGKDRRAVVSYLLRYKWEGGGLFGGRSVRLLSLSKG